MYSRATVAAFDRPVDRIFSASCCLVLQYWNVFSSGPDDLYAGPPSIGISSGLISHFTDHAVWFAEYNGRMVPKDCGFVDGIKVYLRRTHLPSPI